MAKHIGLTQGKFAIVDDADYEWLSQHKWYAAQGSSTYYARRMLYGKAEQKEIRMHRAILKPPPGMESDHINGDGLDNRRCNLRTVTRSQNSMNRRNQMNCSSRHKGVSWDSRDCKWRVQIKIDGRGQRLGYFDDEQEAARIYNQAAKRLFGEFARLNILEEVGDA